MEYASIDRRSRFCIFLLAGFALLLACGFIVLDSISPAGRKLAKIAGDDPPLYFDVSHALLFHRNFDIAQEYSRVRPESDIVTPVSPATGHRTSPFPIGYSILSMPLLAAGTAADFLAGNSPDGYGRFAILGYCLTNVVLTALGLIALFVFLRDAGAELGVPRNMVLPLALLMTFAVFAGTNVGYYAFSEMSHAATFFAVSIFMARWWRIRDSKSVSQWALLGAIGGGMALCRWQDVFFGIAPIIYDLVGSRRVTRHLLASRAVYAFIAGICCLPQFLEWKYMFGTYITIPQGADFIVLPPGFILKVLFSSRNGWLTWTPLILIGLCGLLFGAARNLRLFVPWLIAIALEVSLIGSLPTTWHGGDGFSNRYLLSSAVPVALGLMVFGTLPRVMRRMAYVSMAVACVFAVVFAIQLRFGLVPRLDRLTASELFTDKLRLPKVRQRKLAVARAEELLRENAPEEAAASLRNVEGLGPDREVLRELSTTYRSLGREAMAQDADRQLAQMLASRLY